MAGSDSSRAPLRGGGPAVVLVEPQLGENIGAAARAMANGGLSDLRLVSPREAWPNARARASASGADWVLDTARVFDRVEKAVADLRYLWAATARPRDMVKGVATPRQAVAQMRRRSPPGAGCGILFGPERTGLTNEHLTLAREVLWVPLDPAFSSLNLAQAVMVVAYEWFQAGRQPEDLLPRRYDRGARAATSEELAHFFAHLEQQLDATGFFRPPEKRPVMVRNLRNLFLRAEPTEQEIRTLHGVVRALSGKKWEELQ